VAGGASLGSTYAGYTAPTNGLIAEGNVGIGTTSPGYKLEVYTGSATGYVVTADGSWGSTSDVRMKKNISPLDSALEKVMALNPVTFNMKNEPDSASRHLGFIAQDVEKISPELVSTDGRGYKGLSYAMFTPLLVKAVQEQQAQIGDLQVQSSNLKAQNENLNLKIDTSISSVQELQTAVNEKLNVISSSFAALDTKIAATESQVADLQSKVVNYQSQITDAQARLLEAENNLTAFQNSVNDTLSAMLETENMLTERVLNHEDRIRALEDKLAAMTVAAGGEIPKNVITMDENGNAALEGIFKAKEVEAKGVVAGSYSVKNEESAPTTGEGTIVAVKIDADGNGWDDVTQVDGKSAQVTTAAVTESAKIFVTFEGDPGSRWWIEKIRDPETGNLTGQFSINVAEAVKKDVKFSWFIVEAK
jgi:peptidoglycan hydrolase CwlO-like protein